MKPFKYTSAATIEAAVGKRTSAKNALFLGGGTNLVDLMKEGVEQPDELVDINGLDLTAIKKIANGISIGALATNSNTANHPLVRKEFPVLSRGILAGASAQIRNMATNGGNILQRTRCPYFYDVNLPCNKRLPGSGCGAINGFNRMHAVFGWSEQCVAVFPSDMSIALSALDAVVTVAGPGNKQRDIPFANFHRLPGDQPEKDNNLQPGELITSIQIPQNNFAGHSYYLKIRDRSSYAFALVAVAAGLELKGSTIVKANISMGGVAHKPWRAHAAEAALAGKQATAVNFKNAAIAEMEQAKPLSQNKFKVQMGIQAITHALEKAFKQDQ